MSPSAAVVSADQRRANNLRGAGFMVLSTTCLALDAGLIRVTSRTVHTFEIAFFRSLFSFCFMAPWLLRAGSTALATSRLPLHLVRAVLKLVSLCTLFYAISVLPLSDVTAISFTAPFFVAIGARFFLGESLHLPAWLAVVTGFAGVLIVLRPGTGVFEPVVLLAVLSAACSAGIIIVVKFLNTTEPPVRLVGLNLALSVVLALVASIPVWSFPDPRTLGLLAGQGVLGLISQASIVRAMGLADASSVMPLEFVRLPLVVVIAWVAFDEGVEVWTVLGGIIIFAASFGLVRVTMARRPALIEA